MRKRDAHLWFNYFVQLCKRRSGGSPAVSPLILVAKSEIVLSSSLKALEIKRENPLRHQYQECVRPNIHAIYQVCLSCARFTRNMLTAVHDGSVYVRLDEGGPRYRGNPLIVIEFPLYLGPPSHPSEVNLLIQNSR